MTIAERNAYVIAYLPIARRIARKIARTRPRADVDDLAQSACMRLLREGTRFDPARGLRFSTFASTRVHGAMIDTLRAEHGRIRGGQSPRVLVPLDDADRPLTVDADAHGLCEANEDAARLAEAIMTLGERERRVIAWSFWHELPLLEIGQRLGVKASRASQIRKKALASLRAALG
jgi:RNA polymerase sigma factor FliA